MGEGWKVDLSNPGKVVCVEVWRAVCGVVVLEGEGWMGLGRFNLAELGGGGEGEGERALRGKGDREGEKVMNGGIRGGGAGGGRGEGTTGEGDGGKRKRDGGDGDGDGEEGRVAKIGKEEAGR